MMKVGSHTTTPYCSMRKLCPNLDREDGLDTVLEVPIPEEMFAPAGGGGGGRSGCRNSGTGCTNMMAWMRSQVDHRSATSAMGRSAELQLMLGVVGAPLVPLPVPTHHSIVGRALNDDPIGLDPRSTANLFAGAVCIGEKAVNDDDCFVLRLDAETSTLRSRSSSSVEIIRHTLWGYFSQRTALLVQLEDSHLLRIKSPNQESVYWETTMASSIDDYRPVDGVQIAHAGRTSVSLFRFGETAEEHTRTRMEEAWTLEEVDFNIWGLSMDCFLPPGDIKEEKECPDVTSAPAKLAAGRSPLGIGNFRIGASRIAAVNIEDSDDGDEAKDGKQRLLRSIQ